MAEQGLTVKSGQVIVSSDVQLGYQIYSSSPSSSEESLKLLMIMGAFATMKHFEESAEHLVQHFSRSIDILIYDHRGIGKSTSTSSARQTSRLLADDALFLINQVWGDQSTVHIYGASLGGMVAQELSLLLLPSHRLRSLYLAVTSRGSYIRPLPFSSNFWQLLMPLLIKKDREQMVRDVLLPATFSTTTQAEQYATRWINEYEQWWAFHDRHACASQCSVVASHYLSDERARLLATANIPITVQIATQDKLMSPSKQQQLARLLKAKTIVFDQGHLGDDQVKKQIYQSIIQHLQSAL